ncbi:MAG: cytochrome c peroxidase, partial [Desulfobaccales bacterium]
MLNWTNSGRPQAVAGRLLLTACLSLGLVLSGAAPPGPALAQQGGPNPEMPPSLKVLTAPEPPDLADYIQDKASAIQLGKALFWDMQVGSDGIVACASCHFHAGADARRKNQLSPGLLNQDFSGIPGNKYYTGGDVAFGNAAIAGVAGRPRFKPNYTLDVASDFPFHARQDAEQQESPPLRDANDVSSSQGVKVTIFTGINPGSAQDSGTPVFDPVFTLGGGTSPSRNLRRVEPVNSPTVINSVFNFSNFWNGRANHIFNGENSFGPADQAAGIWVNNLGNLQKVPLTMKFASLASQATAPPVSDFEMSFGPNLDTGAPGRTWAHIGKKMLTLRPLGKQLVHPADSVLGGLSRAGLSNGAVSGQPGLNTTYGDLIRAAFKPEYWNSSKMIRFTSPNAVL